MRKQLKEADECNRELEEELRRRNTSIGKIATGEADKCKGLKSASVGKAGNTSETTPKRCEIEMQIRTGKKVGKTAPAGNDVYDGIMDMMVKFVPVFFGGNHHSSVRNYSSSMTAQQVFMSAWRGTENNTFQLRQI